MGRSLSQIFLTRVFLSVFILMLSSLSLGIAIAYPSPAMPVLRTSFHFTSFDESLFGALTSLTAVCGPFVTGPVLARSGRRGAVRAITAIFIIAWCILLVSSADRKILCHIHRAVLGVAAGGVSSVVPMYIMELSPLDLRSIYGSLHQFAISFGIFLINFLGMYFDWWRLGLISLVIAIGLGCGLSFVPEPGHSGGPGSVLPESQVAEGLCGARYYRYFMIGVLMMFFQQVSGINAVLTNLSTILVSKAGPALAASSQCFAVVCCIVVIDRIGRMNAWAVSLFGSAISMFVLALGLRFEWNAAISTVAAFGFLFFFCFGLGPIPWFLPPEFFPDHLRATATSIFSSLNWILSFSVVFLYPIGVAHLGVFPVLVFFTIVLVAGGLFGFAALNPTKRRDISEERLQQGAPIASGFQGSD
jgi:MFS family permease